MILMCCLAVYVAMLETVIVLKPLKKIVSLFFTEDQVFFSCPSLHQQVCTEGRLMLEFAFDDLMRIKTWHFTVRQFRELLPRSILAMHVSVFFFLDCRNDIAVLTALCFFKEY